MRKALLSIGIAVLALGSTASAQILTQNGKDSAIKYFEGGTTLEVKNNIRSADPTKPVVLRWNIITASTRFDAGWEMQGTGFCDNTTCYTHDSTVPVFTVPTIRPTAPYDHNGFVGTSHNFYITFITNNPADHSSAVVRVNAYDTSSKTTRTLTFIGYKAPAGISGINSSDEIVMYPLPARESLNLVYDEKAGVSTIVLYNLIGKRVGPVYKPGAAGSAKLELRDLPDGIYFLKMLNAQGQVLATRRFTHQ